MKKPHKIIFLQWVEPDEEEGVTWCQDKINDTDVEYIRKDVHDKEMEGYLTLIAHHKEHHENDKRKLQ